MRSDSITPNRKKNTGGRPSKNSGLVEVDEFEPIDFRKSRTSDLIIEDPGGSVCISGYWTDGYVVRLPRTVCVSVAGVNINPKDAIGEDRNTYIRSLQDKIGDVLLSSIQAEGHIYSTYKEAVEFSKRFTSLLLRHVRMTDPEFLQVCRMPYPPVESCQPQQFLDIILVAFPVLNDPLSVNSHINCNTKRVFIFDVCALGDVKG